jgi:ParB-like nuclease family protein
MKMVAVSEILSKVYSTADGYDVGDGPHEWFRLIGSKMQDRQTPAIIRAIQDNGFNVPICIEVYQDEYWKLGNGHHRLAIAILLGLDEIPVDFSGWYTKASTQESEKIEDSYNYGDSDLSRWISHTAAAHEDMLSTTYDE